MSAPLLASSQPDVRSTSSIAAATPSTVPNASLGLDSAQLLNGQKAVTILHNGTPYRLQATKLGKLILTKYG